jgi:hypothetical protein
MSGLGQGAIFSDWDFNGGRSFDFLHFVHEGHFRDDTYTRFPFLLFSLSILCPVGVCQLWGRPRVSGLRILFARDIHRRQFK